MKPDNHSIFSKHVLLTIIVSIITCMDTVAQYQPSDTITRNLYLKFNIDINRRNIILAAVPNLYIITDGPRHYVGETYGKFHHYPDGHFGYDEQLRISTVRHRQRVFSTLLSYITPNPYNTELFFGQILSPFCKENRRFYRYSTMPLGGETFITFRPKVANSTLTRGSARIDSRTKKIITADFEGEYEQVKYHVDVDMDSLTDIPKRSQLQAKFLFFGNSITTKLSANYNNNTTLTDSITTSNDPHLMSIVRTDSLTDSEKAAYAEVYKPAVRDTASTPRKRSFLDKTWSAMYDYLIASIRFSNDNTRLRLSPILDPAGLGYSSSKGISYRMKLRTAMKTSGNSDITLNAYGSYYTRQKRFYYDVPLRYTFNEQRNGFAELYFANGSRISDSRILDMLSDNNRRDTIDFDKLELHYFKDLEVNFQVNIPIGRLFFINLASVYHLRNALHKDKLAELGEKTVYRTFAPSITLKYQPSRFVAYTLNYERGIANVLRSDTRYERIEADAQFSKKYNALTSLNIRVGGGGYTQLKTTYFVDYKNFKENYLPDTWDEWKGHFFLLRSDLYNASSYYARVNISYESPLLPLAYIPYIGYYIQKECMYLNAVQLQHTHTYYELGYSFTTRYGAFGLFGSFFGSKFKEIGTKITFELFQHW